MTSVVVIDENEISLNGTLYPLARPVQRFLASIYPGKVVVGDTSRDSNPNASPLALSDWSGGIGLNKDEGVSPQPRAWWSTANLRSKTLTLPGLAVETAASGVAGVFTVGAIGFLGEDVYAAFGSSVRKYDNGADSWGSSLHSLPAVATDATNIRIGGTEYLVFAHTGGYTYFDGTTWSDDTTKATKFLEFWDDKLWGIGNTGLLWHAATIGTETNDAQLPLPDGSITALFQARNSSGDVVLYAGTKRGLYAHDADGSKWVRVDALQLPLQPDGAKGSAAWRDSIYTSAGLAVYKFINGSNSAVLTIAGPDRDDGVPSGKGGIIRQFVPTHNDLIALNDATAAFDRSTLDTFVTKGFSNHRGVTMNPDTGFSSILGYNDIGWEVKWLSAVTDEAVTFGMVTTAYGEYRFWWGLGGRVYYMEVPSQIVNPNELSDLLYAASADHETPWFNIGQMEVNKLALRLKVDTLDLSATETVTVSYGLNLSTSWTALTAITTGGVTTFDLPSTASPTGVAFRWIRFRVQLARGSTTTLTPQMVNLTLEYRKKLPEKWAFQVSIDMSRMPSYKGKTPTDLRDDLISAVQSETLVEFLWRDDASGSESFYVDVGPVTGLEHTGHDPRGDATVQLTQR